MAGGYTGAELLAAGAGADSDVEALDPWCTYLMLNTLIRYGSKLTKKFVSFIGWPPTESDYGKV